MESERNIWFEGKAKIQVSYESTFKLAFSLVYIQTGKPQTQDSLLIVPDAADLRIKPTRFNVSLAFPSKDLAVVCNGSDQFYLLDTGDRSGSAKWKV